MSKYYAMPLKYANSDDVISTRSIKKQLLTRALYWLCYLNLTKLNNFLCFRVKLKEIRIRILLLHTCVALLCERTFQTTDFHCQCFCLPGWTNWFWLRSVPFTKSWHIKFYYWYLNLKWGSQRLWPVVRSSFLSGTWSYIWRRSVLLYSRFCNCHLDFDYFLNILNCTS
jgi:hypothetical protein